MWDNSDSSCQTSVGNFQICSCQFKVGQVLIYTAFKPGEFMLSEHVVGTGNYKLLVIGGSCSRDGQHTAVTYFFQLCLLSLK